MKLIIDISEEAKRHIDTFKGKFLCGDGCDMIQAIQNGIPLDDVKAEIAKPIQEECCYIGEARIQADTIKWCLEILDNIGKAESED